MDGEEDMYRQLRELNIAPITASQKLWLTQFHAKVLDIVPDSSPGWVIRDASAHVSAPRLPSGAYVDRRQDSAR